MIPKDPAMLLSFVNMKLRDYDLDLEALCRELETDRTELEAKLAEMDYHYDREQNQFV